MKCGSVIYVISVMLLAIASVSMLGCPDDTSNNDVALVCDANEGYYENNAVCVRPTGVFVEIGADVVAFGVAESDPRGFTAIGNTLYMIGGDAASLYTVSTTDGTATKIGDGLGPTDTLRGLAVVDNTLYMVADNNDLLEVNTETGVATSSSLSFGVTGTHEPQGLVAVSFEDEVFLLMATTQDGDSNPTLYALNASTRTSVPLVSDDLIDIVPDLLRYTNITGAAFVDDTVFAVVNGDTDALYIIDTSFAKSSEDAIQAFTDDTILMPLGSATTFGVGEDAPRGLAVVGDVIYMVGTNGLYRALTEQE